MYIHIGICNDCAARLRQERRILKHPINYASGGEIYDVCTRNTEIQAHVTSLLQKDISQQLDNIHSSIGKVNYLFTTTRLLSIFRSHVLTIVIMLSLTVQESFV